MSESEKFDAIIVGGGIAGLTAGYILAKEGLDVLLIERGNYPGSKNMTGGRLYSHSLEKIIPDFAKEAPVQRKIVHEKISMMTEESAFTIDYTSPKIRGPRKRFLFCFKRQNLINGFLKKQKKLVFKLFQVFLLMN